MFFPSFQNHWPRQPYTKDRQQNPKDYKILPLSGQWQFFTLHRILFNFPNVFSICRFIVFINFSEWWKCNRQSRIFKSNCSEHKYDSVFIAKHRHRVKRRATQAAETLTPTAHIIRTRSSEEANDATKWSTQLILFSATKVQISKHAEVKRQKRKEKNNEPSPYITCACKMYEICRTFFKRI